MNSPRHARPEEPSSPAEANQQPLPRLDLCADPVALTQALVDIPSESHKEARIADAIEAALRAQFGDAGAEAGAPAPIEILRVRNNVLARTHRGLDQRVILAGHIDTVPIADNVPSRLEDGILHGCGSVDMKSGMAVYLHAFATLARSADLSRDLTLICYEAEEVASQYNGLAYIQRELPDWLHADLALLGEPTGGDIEAGCQGSIRLRITARGTRAHSARAWLGDNAIHRLTPVLKRVADYQPRDAVDLGGCVYREGLNVVHVEGGVATNTIPDEAWCFVNFRFAPDRSTDEAMAHLLDVLALGDDDQLSWEPDDVSAAAHPGLGSPVTQELIDALGGTVRAKYGWTDVARFAAAGVPALNLGCGDPGYAHKRDEQCPVEHITRVAHALGIYLTARTQQS